MKYISRRNFLAAALISIAALWAKRPAWLSPGIKGKIEGASHSIGHKIREAVIFKSTSSEAIQVVIVGSGIAGLSAARELEKNGLSNYCILELESIPGGNSCSGENQHGKYPWAAHYVPFVNKESTDVKELFEELGVIKGYNKDGLPEYEESYVCAAPEERLFIHGRWQEGIIPTLGISETDKIQIAAFNAKMESLRDEQGSDGKFAFSIPLNLSSTDAKYLRLDQINMKTWLEQNNYTSPPLHWYVNYCCKDDYGAEMQDVSAWAGIHYFAGRRGDAANAHSNSVLTWPEGNGWIVKKIIEKLKNKPRLGQLAINIKEESGKAQVTYLDRQTDAVKSISADYVLYAAPRFTAAHIFENLRSARPEYLKSFQYSPWLVANLSIYGKLQGSEKGFAWDNVAYSSKSLGYVNSSHQILSAKNQPSILTYYLPLSDMPAKDARQFLIGRTHEELCELVLKDLSSMHRDIRDKLINMDFWLWGHGMIRPTPGFIWGEHRQAAQKPLGLTHFAHSDMSGISIFEEAQHHGIRAAREIIARIA